MMSNVYALQRANGDWFALDQVDGLRVPVFSSSHEAMRARAFNVEMLVFKPVLLNESALKEMVPANGQPAAHFWLVKDECVNLKRGVALQYSKLAEIIRDREA
jgi:hypothetical protein